MIATVLAPATVLLVFFGAWEAYARLGSVDD